MVMIILKITLWENANTKLSLLICKLSNVTNLRKFQTTGRHNISSYRNSPVFEFAMTAE